MNLIEIKTILAPLLKQEVINLSSASIGTIVSDSRKAQLGDLFVAIPGTAENGNKYITDALQKGCSAVVTEEYFPFPEEYKGVALYVVTDSREALACLSCAFYGHPSRKLTMVGVTGTNGKTTTATLLYSLFSKLGYRCALISTVCVRFPGYEREAHHTTPDALELNSLLAEAIFANCSHIFMEVSSHSLVQKRVLGIDFDVAVFTNLTRDHLDYHRTFAEYIKAKKIFFDTLSSKAWAIVNKDDKNGLVMVQNTKASVATYAVHSAADYKATVLEQYLDGTLLTLDGVELHSRLCGVYNAYNLLAVYAVAKKLLQQGEQENLFVALSELISVDGRFEVLRSPNGFYAVIDYAHTPDALENVLLTVKALSPTQIITVVGAGGNRDKGKRPQMARVAAEYSTDLILTSDNPRFEDPYSILQEMQSGLNKEQMATTLMIENRREAIKTACRLAHSGGVILIAGKGHETYQEIAGVRHHFDDREVVRELFCELEEK